MKTKREQKFHAVRTCLGTQLTTVYLMLLLIQTLRLCIKWMGVHRQWNGSQHIKGCSCSLEIAA
jgi:hypothetical protein